MKLQLHLAVLPPQPLAELGLRLLDAEEQRQLAAFAEPRARLLHLAGRLLIKRVAAERSGLPAAELAVRRDGEGRPWLPLLPGLHVSLSHAIDRVACVLAPAESIGLDLECPHRRLPSVAARLRFLDDVERRWLQDQPAHAQAQAFLRLWTHKEAVLKADGRGMAMGLAKVRLQPGAEGALDLRDRPDGRPWSVLGGQCGGYPWALAWDSSRLSLQGVSLHRFTWCTLVQGLESGLLSGSP